MLYLVGSHALKHYGVDLGRPLGDVDLFSDRPIKYDNLQGLHLTKVKDTEKGEIYQLLFCSDIVIDLFHKNLWDTDRLFLNSIHGEHKKINIKSYIFSVIVAPKEVLYIMYKTTAEVYKDEKSVRDFETIQKAWPNFSYRHELYTQRLKETQDYYDKTKKQFFEQHGVRQFIDHDKIHQMVSNMYGYNSYTPKYKLILKSQESTEIDINKFKEMSNNTRISILAEEVVTLLFERYFIYNTVTKGFKDSYVKAFFNNGKHSITNQLVHHVCERGLRGEHPEIIDFAGRNVLEIKKEVNRIKKQLKGKPLPTWFLEELEQARNKYEKEEEIPF